MSQKGTHEKKSEARKKPENGEFTKVKPERSQKILARESTKLSTESTKSTKSTKKV